MSFSYISRVFSNSTKNLPQNVISGFAKNSDELKSLQQRLEREERAFAKDLRNLSQTKYEKIGGLLGRIRRSIDSLNKQKENCNNNISKMAEFNNSFKKNRDELDNLLSQVKKLQTCITPEEIQACEWEYEANINDAKTIEELLKLKDKLSHSQFSNNTVILNLLADKALKLLRDDLLQCNMQNIQCYDALFLPEHSIDFPMRLKYVKTLLNAKINLVNYYDIDINSLTAFIHKELFPYQQYLTKQDTESPSNEWNNILTTMHTRVSAVIAENPNLSHEFQNILTKIDNLQLSPKPIPIQCEDVGSNYHSYHLSR